MDIGKFRKVAWSIAERIADRVSGGITSLPALSFVIYEMQNAYEKVQEPVCRDIEQVKAFNRSMSEHFPYNEAEYDSLLARYPFLAAEQILMNSSDAETSASISIRRAEEYRGTDNPKVYFIRGKDGRRVSLEDIKGLYKQRKKETHHVYVFNMVSAIANMTDRQKKDIYQKTTSPDQKLNDFEFGETTYAYGIRMLTNTIRYHLADPETGKLDRDAIMAATGLKGNVADGILKTVFDDIEADINHRLQNRGKILPPRGGKIGANVKLEGRAPN